MGCPWARPTSRCARGITPMQMRLILHTVACCRNEGNETGMLAMQMRCILALLAARASITRPQIERVQSSIAGFELYQRHTACLQYDEVWAVVDLTSACMWLYTDCMHLQGLQTHA